MGHAMLTTTGRVLPGRSHTADARRNPSLRTAWATHLDEVREAQRLRYQVFADEMGARIQSPLAGFDIDRFDDHCEHLLVRDAATDAVVGTYRLLTPQQALRIGGTYTDTEFDLAPLKPLRARMVELGRSCVHADHRQGHVILALWSALAEFMARHELETMVGCASIPLGLHAAIDHPTVAALWHQACERHLCGPEWRVVPWRPSPFAQAKGAEPVAVARSDMPPLIRGYLRLGAKVLGPPAWDPDFRTADLPLMMRIDELPGRYAPLSAGLAR